MIKPRFCLPAAIQSIGYLINLVDENSIERERLPHILYFAERDCYTETGCELSGSPIMIAPEYPALKWYYNMFWGVVDECNNVFDFFFEHGKEISMIKDPGTGYMSRHSQSLLTGKYKLTESLPVDLIRIVIKTLPEFKPYTRTNPHIARALKMEEYLSDIGYSTADIGDYIDQTNRDISMDKVLGKPSLPVEWSDYDIPE